MVTIIVLMMCASMLVAIQVQHKKAVARLYAPYAPKELSAPEGTAPNDVLQCAMYEVRLTQQKMVDAGILEQWELSNCENEDCDNCYITDPMRNWDRIPRYRRKREMIEPKEMTDKTVFVNGQEINIPAGVPANAHVSATNRGDGFFDALWSWIDQSTGYKMGMKSIHPVKSSFVAGPKASSRQIHELRKDAKRLKSMLNDSKKQLETYNKSMVGLCGCERYVVVDGTGTDITTFKGLCEYHQRLAKYNNRIGTGDLGAG